jgi:hypothetical protein
MEMMIAMKSLRARKLKNCPRYAPVLYSIQDTFMETGQG